MIALAVTAVLVSCSKDDVVLAPVDAKQESQIPIGFSAHKQNITRAANLETFMHYNFGVWAWAVQGLKSQADAEQMKNYLVGYSDGISKGYDKTNASTWGVSPDSPTDQKSPWFYEKLGKAEYTYSGTDGFYTNDQTDFISANTNQTLQYWDRTYDKTHFYCYAPYDTDVTFTKGVTSSTMTFAGASTIRDGYDEPLDSTYISYNRTLSEFMYAGVQATNADLATVTIPFKHMGAQLFIRFYEDIPGYKVEIIDLGADNGTMVTDTSTYMAKGIQAAPAIKSETTYTKGSYYTTQGATISFAEDTATPTYTPNWTGSTTAQRSLMFKIPQEGLSTASEAPANLTDYAGLGTITHHIIQEKAASGSQTYSYSPTIYYPVAQPDTSSTGFTFHVSYRLIAEDNKEVITIHNTTVHVPAYGTIVTGTEETSHPTPITVWQPNMRYTYTFKFTANATGSSDSGTLIDPTDPTPGTAQSLFPIVFDAATLGDYTETSSDYFVK